MTLPPLLHLLAQQAPKAAGPVTDPAQVRAELEQVLAEPEFHRTYTPDLFTQAGQWLLSWMNSLQGSMRELGYLDQLARVSHMVMWVVLLLTVASLIYWGVKLILNRRQLLEDWAGDVPTGRPHFEPPAAYEPRIAEAAHRGQWGEAVLQSWRRFLSQVERAGLVEADRSKTNREYGEQIAAHGAEPAATVRELIAFYDGHIYGQQPVDEPGWMRWKVSLDDAARRLKLEPADDGGTP